ncbi:nucleotidyltransferase domain-containing protein [Halorubrum halophilum]|uniref:nucleotidyltransferase domain-containing protein n=1 Tax=Halorubrum halophilum TaxID=413816 RepID=UPI000679B5BB|nr:nucleotidyltransferase domain-containing protein [Halorubrum halophilum]
MAGSNHGGSAIGGVDVAAIRQYLAETDVRFAILFGSRVRGDTHDSSDVDVYRERIDAEYERTAADWERDRREFIDRLAKGDI